MTTIPTDPTKFKQWADTACVDWPGELQAQAYRAWRAMLDKNRGDAAVARAAFTEAYNTHTVQRMRMEKSSEKVA